MMKLNDLIGRLEVSTPKLPVNLQRTAVDLYTKARSTGRATEPQIRFMVSLVKQAGGEDTRPKAKVGEMAGVIALFDKAKEHLKAPAIVIANQSDEGVSMIRLKLAGSTSKYQGEVNVKTETGEWIGRIARDGVFVMSRDLRDLATAITPLLSRFAADPITGAKESARLTGKCVFCNTKLTDERSTNVGYGKICASRYELPWG